MRQPTSLDKLAKAHKIKGGKGNVPKWAQLFTWFFWCTGILGLRFPFLFIYPTHCQISADGPDGNRGRLHGAMFVPPWIWTTVAHT